MSKITWSGQSFFQISVSNSKDHSAQIAIDPFDAEIGLKVPNVSTDVLLITHNHHDHNNKKAVKGEPFLIEGPGEYEIKGIFIKGIPAFHDDAQGKERGNITIYTIEAEGLRFCHLGDLGQKQLTDEQVEEIGQIDVLMIPVGGVFTISSQEAVKIISQIEPKIVIPMHYSIPHLKIKLDGVDKFLKAIGKNSVVPQEKLLVKLSALPKEGMDIVVLLP
ncbi:MBL fold metallo-hydrolase [Patescibacteria group bacterium]|nr:MBL fold metallo-hydrolase [Patescibacteria group bacterium]